MLCCFVLFCFVLFCFVLFSFFFPYHFVFHLCFLREEWLLCVFRTLSTSEGMREYVYVYVRERERDKEPQQISSPPFFFFFLDRLYLCNTQDASLFCFEFRRSLSLHSFVFSPPHFLFLLPPPSFTVALVHKCSCIVCVCICAKVLVVL